jgi:hypothetical protein
MVGYAIECTLKARISIYLNIPRWTKICLDHVDHDAFSHDLHSFARLANAAPATLRRVQQVNWHPQLRYHASKIAMSDAEKRHTIALEAVRDIEALMGGV